MVRSDQLRGRTGHANVYGIPDAWRSYNHSLRLLDNNDSEAFRLNQIAAQNGMHDAVLAMGWFYLNGVGVKADKEEAIRWYRKSARQGDERAMFSLGQIAYIARDYSEALLWFKRAADKGHCRSDFWIGKLYWRGQGVAQDRQVAHKHFVRASAEKLIEAQRVIRYLAFLARLKSSER
ncbi:MAG: tetratricopeptide repeat protein [Devosia sp.]|nr:tetratricopeptide repeat protein [Devosia sp.]